MKVQVAGGDNRVIDPGMYRVKCTAVTAEDAPNDAFGKTKKFRLTLKTTDVVDQDGEGVELERTVNRAYTVRPKKSNLFVIFEAFGLPVNDPEYVPDTDDLLGKEAQAVVVDYTSERDGGQWSRVENFIAISNGNGIRAKAPSAAQEARAPWEGEAVDADTASAWWKARLGEGFERAKVIDLCEEMFEGRIPGELNAKELAGLTDQLNATA